MTNEAALLADTFAEADDAEFVSVTERFQLAKTAREQAQTEYDKASAALTDFMRTVKESATEELVVGDTVYRVTIVQGTRTVIDTAGMKANLPATVFEMIADVTVSINETKLEEAIIRGQVPPEIVQDFVTVRHNKAYPRITPVGVDEATDG